jgi:hypothetical protein
LNTVLVGKLYLLIMPHAHDANLYHYYASR